MNRSTLAALPLLCLPQLTAPALAQAPRVELDHVYIVVSPGAASEMAALQFAGLTVDATPTKHEGEGTTSVAVLFENAYLELIWIDSSVAVDPEHAATAQWFRDASAWRTNGHSPFGLGLRRVPGDTAALPVPVERESAPWLEPGAAYELLHQPADSLATDFFVVPALAAVPTWVPRVQAKAPELLRHAGGGRTISLVRLHGPENQQPTAFHVLRPGSVEMLRASAPLLELQLDKGARGQRLDLRPTLPLLVVR